MLLPLRWETHSAPEYGRRPQEVINRQVVDRSDLVVGIFWTRIGSPTGVADSGTLEEIERVASLGKPVMLYFSQIRQDPERIDVDQLVKLRAFKAKTFPKALIEHYTSQIEFRDKLSKQLEIQLRTLLAEENQNSKGQYSSAITDIQFDFADPRTGNFIGPKLQLQNTVIELEGLENLPDFDGPYTDEESTETPDKGSTWLLHRRNANFYREMASYLVRENFYHPIRFWMKNVGGVGARDVYVDIRIASADVEIIASSIADASLKPPSKSGLFFYGGGREESNQVTEHLGKQWTTQLELSALQPQREISPSPRIAVGAKSTGQITVTARIYADTLPEPVTRTLQIDWTSKIIRKKAVELLQEAGITIRPPNKRRQDEA